LLHRSENVILSVVTRLSIQLVRRSIQGRQQAAGAGTSAVFLSGWLRGSGRYVQHINLKVAYATHESPLARAGGETVMTFMIWGAGKSHER